MLHTRIWMRTVAMGGGGSNGLPAWLDGWIDRCGWMDEHAAAIWFMSKFERVTPFLLCFALECSFHYTLTLILTHARVSASSFCERGTILIINQGFVNKCQRCEISISHQNSSKLTIANWQFSLLSLLWLPLLLLLLSLSLSCRSHSHSRSSELTSLLANVASLISGWVFDAFDFPEKLFDGT